METLKHWSFFFFKMQQKIFMPSKSNHQDIHQTWKLIRQALIWLSALFQGGNNISAKGTSDIASALKENSTITTVCELFFFLCNCVVNWEWTCIRATSFVTHYLGIPFESLAVVIISTTFKCGCMTLFFTIGWGRTILTELEMPALTCGQWWILELDWHIGNLQW
jgi:hypothetical protein